ncbi:MAG: hypothetical protein ACOCVI_02380 [Planctomycetota bacterium]
MKQQTAMRALRVWLVVGGVSLLAALVGVFMPFSWMDAAHRWMDLGPIPSAGIVEYLARALSAMYAMLGGLFLICAADPVRLAAVVTYALISVAAVAIGMLMILSLTRPELVPWIAADAISASVYAAVGLFLQRAARVGPGSAAV